MDEFESIQYMIDYVNESYKVFERVIPVDIITDITTDSDISIIVDNKEINNFKNLTLPIISLKENIYIKLNNKTSETFNVSYKGYILNGISRLEFSSYYNKHKIYNNYGLEFIKGNLNKNNI